MDDLAALATEQFCYLTTTGRKSGSPHEIEIWFGMTEGTVYMLSGGGEKSDWVRNLQANPHVALRIGDRTFEGNARVISDTGEHEVARQMLLHKYEPTYSGDLTDWGRTALPIAIDLVF